MNEVVFGFKEDISNFIIKVIVTFMVGTRLDF